MHRKNIQKFLKHRKYFLSAFVLLVGAGLLIKSAFLFQQAGNLFFGRISVLYNVTLAQFFFMRSAYPVFGTAIPFAHYQLSRTHFIQGDLLAAISEAEKELELYPDNIRAYYVLGLTYGYMNEAEKAIEAFSRYIQTDPMSWAARNDKAWLQFRIGDIDGALATIEPVSHDIGNPWVQNTYGTLLMNKERLAEAKQSFAYAKKAADAMTEQEWGISYPGNDPRIYGIGLNAMKLSIESNLELLEQKK